MRTPISLLLLASLFSTLAADERPKLKLENELVQLSIDLDGGSIDSFQLKEVGLNPLSWDSWDMGPDAGKPPPPGPRRMGHFLCLDRWGSPSDKELELGMPKHGEAASVSWLPGDNGSTNSGSMSAQLPLAGFSVRREVEVFEGVALYKITETVTNTRHLGRIYNIVQHPTLAPPFLDASVRVDCNGTRGFMEDRSMPNPEEPEVAWPHGIKMDGTKVDLRYLKEDPLPYVVSYVVGDELGWITATNAKSGLMIGYVWQRSDYPWINMWRHSAEGVPVARGIEFGTAGLHRPMADLVEKREIFGEGLFRFIDAAESQSFSYASFLQEVPADFTGVSNVEYLDGMLRIHEVGSDRRFTLKAKGLFE